MGIGIRGRVAVAGALLAAVLSVPLLSAPFLGSPAGSVLAPEAHADPAGAVDALPGGPGAGAPAEPLIVGGAASTTADYPWVVALLTSSSESAYCGGVLAAPDRVVTAAHCIDGHEPSSIRVIAGRTDLRSTSGAERRITGFWIHPGYRAPMGGDDVAVLTLDRTLPYQAVALEHDPAAYPPGRQATILGWGYTAERGPSSSQLRSAQVPLVSDADCAATYRDFNAQGMVCAGDAAGGVDACYGDSGGPLIAGGKLIGVTSWGSGCARRGTPGVYTRVAAYAAEIETQLSRPTVPSRPALLR